MEQRSTKIIIGTSGGTASKGSKTYKISLPTAWVELLGINENNREVELSFDGEKITISKQYTIEEYASKMKKSGHEIRFFRYYDSDKLCTVICADYTDNVVKAENHTDNLVKTAFGKKTFPTWQDFNDFIKERCIPQSRSGLREYLEAIGVEEYSPLEIIKKTQGRMAEDNQWLEMEELT